MSSFVLVPGAGGVAWYWHLVVARLRDAGHEAIAVDLPGDDPTAGLREYTQLVGDAVAAAPEPVLVAQSLGGFTAAGVAAAWPVRALVLVNAMIPLPGETPGEWGAATGSSEARLAAAERYGYPAEFDPFVYFLHDVPADVVAEGERYQRPETDAVFGSPCAIDAWPKVPTQVVCGADDRLFPVGFQQRVARDRLGYPADVLPGGHLIALAQPERLTAYLLDVQ
jgi:pimeloyl-ACP methyl ester carboxylesterase